MQDFQFLTVEDEYYDYANFVLFADPWTFDSYGHTSNGYNAWIDIDDPTNPLFDIARGLNGTYSHVVQNEPVLPDIAENQWFSWRIEKTTTSLDVYIDNNLIANLQDSSFANSNFKFGLSFGEDSEGYFDNVRIDTVPVPEPATMLLFATGIAGMAGSRLMRKKK